MPLCTADPCNTRQPSRGSRVPLYFFRQTAGTCVEKILNNAVLKKYMW